MFSFIITILPMFVCLFWGIAIIPALCTERKKHHAVLTIFLATVSLLYFGHCIYFNHKNELIPISDSIYSFCNLAVYPLYLCYIKSITTNSKKLWQTVFLHLIPSLFCSICILLTYISMSPSETNIFINVFLYKGSITELSGKSLIMAYLHFICRIVFAIQIPYVVIV
ncbi:MAG: hypothetical protein K6E54_08055, partial [Bacteroidaceae bacterium]|nr:hypothetical protein [Bacteroidaceae bacterium]